MERHGHSVLGVDTHKHNHVAVLLDGLGRHLGELQVPANTAGTSELLAWCDGLGGATVAGVEGTGSYGYPLTRALQRAGIQVLEVNRPDRANRRRGKSDPVDAEAAARAVLSGQATATPKDREGAVEALRALTIARNSAVKATTSASNQMKALLVGADDDLREQMRTPRLLRLAERRRAGTDDRACRRAGQPRPAVACPAPGGPAARGTDHRPRRVHRPP